MCRWKLPKAMIQAKMYHSNEIGFGVKNKDFIPKGEYFLQYTGDVITTENDVLKILMTPHPHYIMELKTHWLRGDSKKGNISKYINHSCNPNTNVEIWLVNGKEKAFFRALEDIQPDSWITYDYNSKYHKERNENDIPRIKCKCCEFCPNFF